MKPVTLGVIVGNRGFFPGHLAETGRQTILKVLEREGIKGDRADAGGHHLRQRRERQPTRRNAPICSRQHRDEIDGVLVTLPNFGDERAIANTLRWAGLNVPVLVHAFPDDATADDHRRPPRLVLRQDVGLQQPAPVRHQVLAHHLHTVDPKSDSFRAGPAPLRRHLPRGARPAAARASARSARGPTAFNTVRYSEKLLERTGIRVETLDLSEVFGRAAALNADDAQRQGQARRRSRPTSPTRSTPAKSLDQDGQVRRGDRRLDEGQRTWSPAPIQCWTSMEEFYGVVPCTLMSMMSNGLMPSACETDIAGVVGMYAMALASGKPSALVDWNNNYGDDPDKGVIFHCSNLPKDIFVDACRFAPDDIPVMDYQAIIAGTVGKDNTYGTVVGRVQGCAVHLLPRLDRRLQRQDRGLRRRGRTDQRPAQDLRRLRRGADARTCRSCWPTSARTASSTTSPSNLSQSADAVNEALSKYLGWQVYHRKKKPSRKPSRGGPQPDEAILALRTRLGSEDVVLEMTSHTRGGVSSDAPASLQSKGKTNP